MNRLISRWCCYPRSPAWAPAANDPPTIGLLRRAAEDVRGIKCCRTPKARGRLSGNRATESARRRPQTAVSSDSRRAWRFFCFRKGGRGEWSVGFFGKSGSARFTGSTGYFCLIFLYFRRCRVRDRRLSGQKPELRTRTEAFGRETAVRSHSPCGRNAFVWCYIAFVVNECRCFVI